MNISTDVLNFFFCVLFISNRSINHRTNQWKVTFLCVFAFFFVQEWPFLTENNVVGIFTHCTRKTTFSCDLANGDWMSTVVNNGGELTVDRERRSSEGAGVVPPFGLHDVAHETTVTDVSVDRLWSTLRWRYLYKTEKKKGKSRFHFLFPTKKSETWFEARSPKRLKK